MGCRFRGEETLAHYSPWSCGTIGPCLSPFEPEKLTHGSAHSCSEHSVRPRTRRSRVLRQTQRLPSGCVGFFLQLCFFFFTQELDSNGGGGGGGGSVGKRWLHSLDHYRRLKDEDPIIPFSEAPIISKWGAISRASRTGYHTTDPVQATACQGGASTTPINFKGESSRWIAETSRLKSRTSFLPSSNQKVFSSRLSVT